MAVPLQLWLKDDGGAAIRGSSDVRDREGSIELRGIDHNRSIPTDINTGKLTGTRQHAPIQFEKEIDSASPYIYKATATGQTLKSAEIRGYYINDAGQLRKQISAGINSGLSRRWVKGSFLRRIKEKTKKEGK